MIFFRYVFILFTLFLATSLYAQNGWTKKAKELYAQAAFTTFNSKDYYSPNNTLFNSGSTFRSHGLLLYGEYGITDQFNVILDVPILMFNHFSSTEVVAGVGNARLGLKYRFFKNFPFSAQVDFDIPTDDGTNLSRSKEPNFLGTYDYINLPTSDGEFNVWTTLAASHSTKNGKDFGSIYSSFNFRTKSFSHQFQAGLEYGHLFFDKLYLIGKFKIQEKIPTDGTVGGSFLYGEGTTFSSYSITSLFKLNDQWRLLGGFSDFIGFPIKKRNIYDGFTFFLGVAIEQQWEKKK